VTRAVPLSRAAGSARAASDGVALVDETQADERQPRLVDVDGARLPDDQAGVAAGGDHGDLVGVVGQLGGHPLDDAVDLAREAVDDARLEGFDGVLGDDGAGPDQLHLVELGSGGGQGVDGDLDAGGGDGADVLALGRDGVEGGGGAEVDDDARAAVLVDGGQRVHDAVA